MSSIPLNRSRDVKAGAPPSRRDASLANWINENKNSFVRWSSASSSSITSTKILSIGAVIFLCVVMVISMQMFLHLSSELQLLKFNFGNAHIITRKQAELLENNIRRVENELNELNKTVGIEFEMLKLQLQNLKDAQTANENLAKAAEIKIDRVKEDQQRMNVDLRNEISQLDGKVVEETIKVDRLINGDGRQFYAGVLTKVCFIQLFLFYLFLM
uniref:Uncharacterized protein n=1 Tax=Romanomermis culicivorax TaxID=13658 RepID=A0A915J5I7_ROMCU